MVGDRLNAVIPHFLRNVYPRLPPPVQATLVPFGNLPATITPFCKLPFWTAFGLLLAGGKKLLSDLDNPPES